MSAQRAALPLLCLAHATASSPTDRAVRHAVGPAATNLGFARFFQRLENGLPVRMIGLGTSVTAMGGGCTHSLVQYCHRRKCCGAQDNGVYARPGEGFLRIAWDWINSTWPHAGHKLYNAGRPGAGGVSNFIGCLSSWLPEVIDLFVLELGATGVKPESVEQLSRLIYRLSPAEEMPAILIFNVWNYRFLNADNASALEATVRKALLDGAVYLEPKLNAVLRYYELPQVSEFYAVWHEFSRTGLRSYEQVPLPPSPAPLRCCRFRLDCPFCLRLSQALEPTAFKRDQVHHSREASRLLGTVLSQHLQQAHSTWRQFGLRGEALRAELAALTLPPPLLFEASSWRELARAVACYTFDRGRIDGTAPERHMRSMADSCRLNKQTRIHLNQSNEC